MIKANLTEILGRIEQYAQAAGRSTEEVKLLAVSKTKPMSLIQEAYAAGQVDFGENRVQELVEKHPQLPEAYWHMIGHLQRNKVKYIAPFVTLIHSIDKISLLKEVNKRAGQNGRIIDCLLQIHIAQEESKHGFNKEEITELLTSGASEDYAYINLRGLMGMATFTDDRTQVASEFQYLSALFKELKECTGKLKRRES